MSHPTYTTTEDISEIHFGGFMKKKRLQEETDEENEVIYFFYCFSVVMVWICVGPSKE